ncbi:hypothetical protein MARGE09_P2084 [Marinagarivorans cellulosilyticus]|uniref:Uncharacterized protein n=1 Tax=Marinagarivorans cellulosilyticus TaxID=2721545 RepID=A0AAN1WHU4_9GAMM|nr:hypothetical protein MARGE09_P2084 [Marinagarivorans cellulosilyticus]
MPNWYLIAFVIALLYFGASTILFRLLTVKRINREVRANGEYYLSTEDSVGYSFFDIALSILLPLKWAKIVAPKIIIDAHSIKKLDIKIKDIVLSYCFMTSTIVFLAIGLYGSRYV